MMKTWLSADAAEAAQRSAQAKNADKNADMDRMLHRE
jgi:hypothetical protein